MARTLVRLAQKDHTITIDSDSDVKQTIIERLPFWRLVNGYVTYTTAYIPLQLFKYGYAFFNSLTKGGVNG